ncbi:MAG: VWA domain-containing protein [Desulfosarcina sp.]|nr:VWA domain-containing protein [Desulfobacterales bacterium]
MKRRPLNVFSLSFIDCICCGLGAIILLFVIVNAKSSVEREKVTQDVHAEVTRIEREVLEGRKRLVELKNAVEKTEDDIARTQGLSRKILKRIETQRSEIAHYEQENLAEKAHLNKPKADLRSLEEDVKRLKAGSQAEDDRGDRVRAFAGEGDRQYLTDLKVGGRRIFILIDTSASMLDETIVGIIRRRNRSDPEKRRAPKWRQAAATVDWLTAQLPSTSLYQIYTFNEAAKALVPGTANQWLPAAESKRLSKAVDRLYQTAPHKGTSLVNAFEALNRMQPPPDNIFLLTDGLPTMGAGKPWRRKVSSKKRLSLFNDAIRKLPAKVPVNVIQFPLEGAPDAASAFWRLATRTRGSYFCPSADWP